MSCFNDEQINRITNLVKEIEKLTDVEKLFLYLQLPCGKVEGVEAKGVKTNGKISIHNGANGGNNVEFMLKRPDQETTQTYTWILSHLEIDPNVSLPKQEVYDDYRAFCQANRFEPLCVADFGKAMKHAFPCIKPRRLGQRGNSRYCYSGLRKKYKVQPPSLPDMIEHQQIVNPCNETNCGSSNSNFSGNGMNVDFSTCPSECPLNQQQATTSNRQQLYNNSANHCGVINLKVEPGNQEMVSSETCTQQEVGTGTTNGLSMNHQLSGGLKQSAQGDQQITNSASIVPYPVIGHQKGSYLNSLSSLSENIGPSLASSSLRQVGTPDDDDYRHNYPDPHQVMIGQMAASCSTSIQFASSNMSQVPTSSVSNAQQVNNQFAYTNSQALISNGKQQQINSVVGHQAHGLHDDAILSNMDSDNTTVIQHQASISSSCRSSAVPVHATVTSQETGEFHDSANGNGNGNVSGDCGTSSSSRVNSNFHQGALMGSLSGPYYESCASPFQSPVSTPYPTLSNYMSNDVQDYYLDCIPYPNS